MTLLFGSLPLILNQPNVRVIQSWHGCLQRQVGIRFDVIWAFFQKIFSRGDTLKNMWDASFFVGYVTLNVGDNLLHPGPELDMSNAKPEGLQRCSPKRAVSEMQRTDAGKRCWSLLVADGFKQSLQCGQAVSHMEMGPLKVALKRDMSGSSWRTAWDVWNDRNWRLVVAWNPGSLGDGLVLRTSDGSFSQEQIWSKEQHS